MKIRSFTSRQSSTNATDRRLGDWHQQRIAAIIRR